MSGDFPPAILIEGAVLAVNELDVNLVLVGDSKLIEAKLKTSKYNNRQIEIEPASEVITMHDDPIQAYKTKKDSSIIKTVLLARQDRVDGFLSPGNTGATFAASLMLTGRLKGVERPAIATLIPTISGTPLVVLDSGANLDYKLINYLQSAIIGRVLIQQMFNIPEPKIGLLNVGEEPGKGTGLLKKVFEEMEKMKINFSGNIESNDVFDGKVNVVVTDGFSGNILLKAIEGTFKGLVKLATREVKKSIFFQTGALLMKDALTNIQRILSSDEYGAAPLLGVDSVAMIGHGNSRQKDIKSGIKMTMQYVRKQINAKITDEIRHFRVNKLHYPTFHHMGD
jgi:glycerol-3-phosphate acyltransferase PlsX